ncbi:MAG: hypothetical protein K0R82_1084 [Flavipsychrobacter sp.]|jgi:hypothetical protein|nr:hypothetical protein [Flavipsychrobacter sp.]
MRFDNTSHKQLSVFAGNWKTTGQTAEGIMVEATDSYEWLPGAWFLLHRWDAVMGEDKSSGIEILGYDAEKQAFHSRFYDDQGNTDAYVIQHEESTWKFERPGERSTVNVSDDGNTLTVLWETADENGNWKIWMNVVLRRV